MYGLNPLKNAVFGADFRGISQGESGWNGRGLTRRVGCPSFWECVESGLLSQSECVQCAGVACWTGHAADQAKHVLWWACSWRRREPEHRQDGEPGRGIPLLVGGP